ncbi:MAG: UDP-N-acetyl-D-mannosamine dehydrogenase [Rhodospirillaceae bacterium]|nr:UDP-N-acetyl-D-mannosamine dehydrogenase [Rhodospirillaceae bacterium]
MTDRPFVKICVIGLGYVGLPTAAVFASRGVHVLGVDTNADAVDLINRGKIHIIEPGLDTMVHEAVMKGLLTAEAKPEAADAHIIAVPTPFIADFKNGHRPDVSCVQAAAESLAPVLTKGSLVIVESTCPVGTTVQVSKWLAEHRSDLTFPHDTGSEADVNIAHSPERVLPGKVLKELISNDRVVGGISPACSERAANLYKIAVEGECLMTTANTAELVKLSENAYRDVNIAFANELSLIAEELDVNVWDAIELANHHPRVNILQPGPGVGGHCIAVDPWFIAHSAPDVSPLIRAARGVNDGKPGYVSDKILDAAKSSNAKTIAILGLAYKADIDDLRESPAIDIAAAVAKDFDGQTLIVEPNTGTLPDSLSGLTQVDLDTALDAAEVVALLVDHKPFRDLATNRLDGKIVIDTRGIWRDL